MKKVAVYIDGSNFYFSIKKKFNCKVDIEKFCKKIVGENELIKVNYYIAPVEQFSNPEICAEQQHLFRKLKKISIKIFSSPNKKENYQIIYKFINHN